QLPGSRFRGSNSCADCVHQGPEGSARAGETRCGRTGNGEEIAMDGTPNHAAGEHKLPAEHYLNATYGIRSWLLTTDHKGIALLYLASVTFFFFVGGIFATLIRIHLLTPDGLLVTPETYNKLFTMHGVAMIFFFLIPSIPAVLGNFL